MNAFLVCVTRWMLASFLVFGALQHSESAIVCQDKPEDPKIVVLGVNNSVVSLNWENCGPDPDDGETIISFSFRRQRPSSLEVEQIASRGPTEGGFTMIAPFQNKNKYDARALQELRILNVQKNEEYVYTLAIHYKTSGGAFLEQPFRVTVDVKVPPKITDPPEREYELNPSSKKNYTLNCNASGDPHPHITWTKAGVPASQFNASGYVLHFVDVKREDAGSYICTASNGFGEDATAISIVNIRCTDCKTETVGITIRELPFKNPFTIPTSIEFKELESSFLSAIRAVYADNPEKELYQVDIKEFRDGSVFAVVELTFGSSVSDPLKPLRDEVNNGKLGSYTVVRELDLNPNATPSTESTEATTGDQKESPSTGARGSSGLSNSELWGIIGGCIAFVIVVAIIILVCCICRKKSKNSGASKGGKSYSEADGYRMNRQPPPSGLGTASPAYVEARQYAPVTAARRQDDQSKPPLNYADLSLNNSSGPGRKPPPYSGTEYSEMSPEKRPPPAGGQQGEGGGFELWC